MKTNSGYLGPNKEWTCPLWRPKDLDAVAGVGAKRWTLQGTGVILETVDPGDQDLKKERGVKREGCGRLWNFNKGCSCLKPQSQKRVLVRYPSSFSTWVTLKLTTSLTGSE